MGISGVFCELKILKFRSQTSTKGGVVRGVFVRGAAKVGQNEHHANALAPTHLHFVPALATCMLICVLCTCICHLRVLRLSLRPST